MSAMPVERAALQGAAGRIEALIHDPGLGRRAIGLVAHPHPLFGGTMENKVAAMLGKCLYELGCVTVRPNFRGVGESEGTHDEGRGESEDLVKIAGWTLQQWGPLPMLLAGFSFGGFVQTLVAQRVEHRQLVLVAPAFSRGDGSGEFKSNTFLIHGDEDDVVPLQSSLDWARARHLPVTVLPGVGHFFHGRLTQLRDLVLTACRF